MNDLKPWYTVRPRTRIADPDGWKSPCSVSGQPKPSGLLMQGRE